MRTRSHVYSGKYQKREILYDLLKKKKIVLHRQLKFFHLHSIMLILNVLSLEKIYKILILKDFLGLFIPSRGTELAEYTNYKLCQP